jgi:Aspartyl protease
MRLLGSMVVLLLLSAARMSAAPVPVAVQITSRGQVFVPLRINGSRSLWFFLDTAAPTSADPSIFRELKLRAEGGYRGRGTGSASIELTRVPRVELAIGAYKLRTPLFGTPVKQLEASLGRTIDGILGAELFAGKAVEIDYEHQRLRIGVKPPRKAVALPITMKQGFPHVEVTLDAGAGPVTGTFLIDTGADTTFDIYKPFADAHSIKPDDAAPGTGLGTGGESKILKTTVRSVALGPIRIDDLGVYLPQDTEGLLAVQDVAGLLGTLFLQRFIVTVDEPHKVVYLLRR